MVTDNNSQIATTDFLPYKDAVSEYRQFSLKIKSLTDPKLSIQIRSYKATKILENYMETQLELERLLLRPFKDDDEIERFYELCQRTKDDMTETSNAYTPYT
eukprot:GHVH01014919.1.p1 GENE.GHVH01014919.1~~GHVH01014919.1.p1  ORF type:complete len:102 (-),score=15.33 GHVH01014919.1:925-1230(-)